jgi:hypothetical protein
VFLISLVLFGKNLFQPLCLFFRNPLIHPCGIVPMKNSSPQRSHLRVPISWKPAVFSRLLYLYRHRYHLCTSWLGILNQASGLTLRISDRNGEAFDVISGRREADDVMPSVTKSPRGAH